MLEEPLRSAASRLRGLRVLIVEDSWHIAKALESLLGQAGMIIVGAAGKLLAGHAVGSQGNAR
jgi:hypothetical protein